ncbi:MAG: hypothetical protein QNJ00_08985 [Woeseiaceae bacterium]|nr:hypothetical protein [Woeseiaceae bacterium]
MVTFKLTYNEIERIKRAAEYAGFPWEPICKRPRTARRFMHRVEAEMTRNGIEKAPVPERELRFAAA